MVACDVSVCIQPVMIMSTSMRLYQPDTLQLFRGLTSARSIFQLLEVTTHTMLVFLCLASSTLYRVTAFIHSLGMISSHFYLCLNAAHCLDNIFVCSPIDALIDNPTGALTSEVCKNSPHRQQHLIVL